MRQMWRTACVLGGLGAGVLAVLLFGFSPIVGVGLILGATAPAIFSA